MGWQTSEPTRLTGYGTEQSYTNTSEFWETVTKVAVARCAENNVCIRVKVTYHYGRAGTGSYSPYQYIYAKLTGVDAYYINRQVSVWGTRTFYYYGPGTAGATQNLTIASSDKSQNYGSHTFSVTYPAYATKYTISYNANGGSGAPGSQTKTYGTALTLSSTRPTRTGYTFQRWNTKTDGTGTSYNAGASYTANAAVTLYAIWAANTYTVTLDAQSGSGGTGSVTATYGASMPAITVPTRAGYTFGGYFTGTNGSGTQYYAASGASANNWGLTAAATLYAKWTANTYTVSFDSQGGSACESMAVTYGTAYGTLPTPTRTNYTFAGWFTAAQGGTQITSASSVSITADHTLYAHWTLNAVTITYHGNGAGAENVPATQDKLIGDTATISQTVPTRTGFTFLSWNTAANGTGISYSGGDSYSTDAPLVLYAQWAAIPIVSDISAVRCNSSGVTTDTDADTYAVIGFDWAVDPAVAGASYTIRWVNRENASNTGSTTGTLSGTSGTVTGVVCGAASGATASIETAYQYDVTITVTDTNSGAGSAEDFVSRAYYVLDFTPGGTGVGIGAPASDGRITTGLPHMADTEERGTHYEIIRNATDNTLLRTLDWDGNMTTGGEITDGGGNVLSEKADASDTYTKAEVDARIPADAHPVGSIYLSTVSTSPASLFGGNWAPIEDVFLLAAGTVYAAGTTGGAATVALDDVKYLPAHTHGSKTLTGTIEIRRFGSDTVAVTGGTGIISKTNHTGDNTAVSFASSGNSYKNDKITITATHEHSSVGSGTAHNNMPPYKTVYMWERIS